MRRLLVLTLLASFAAGSAASADEGMWLLNQFPSDAVKKAYGFAPDQQWLHHAQLGSVRLAGGCSGSFVSKDGLVLTNHHCAHACIEQLSTPTDDRVKAGFLAKTRADEVRCPEIEINDLTDISDVTAEVQKATAGLEGKAYNDARKAVSARIEKACADADANPDRVRCDVVTLFHGGRYDLYKYRRYQDVRLVFAPELGEAFFGGDPDNFNFPRFDLDMSLLRVYQDGKPLHPSDHFRLSRKGTQDGDLTFVSGHPGGTDRQLSLAELLYLRDVAQPDRLLQLAELRGLITEYQQRGAEEKRHSTDLLFAIENSFKAIKGRELALATPPLMDDKAAAEADFKSRIAKDPKLQAKAGGAFDAIRKALDRQREIRLPYSFEEQGRGFQSNLFSLARSLVRAAAERPKPNDTRFPEFRDSVLPQVTQRLFSSAPIFPELEVETLTFSLTKLREALGADDPFVHQVLGKKSPRELAKELVGGTKLADVALRKELWEGGTAAVEASQDPMVLLARRIDGDSRKIRKTYEDEVEAVVKKNEELLAHVRAQLDGTGTYPDATFTLRLSYGQVKGWSENGKWVPPYATLGGAFDRATGEPPFDLPATWLAAQSKLKLDTPLDFVTTNDIIGGNSGSPVLDRKAEVVGLIFDGNIHSLGGDFGYDISTNRAVAVDSRAILEALGRIYGAEFLAKELSQ
jgi:hypothetical protein